MGDIAIYAFLIFTFALAVAIGVQQIERRINGQSRRTWLVLALLLVATFLGLLVVEFLLTHTHAHPSVAA